VPPARARNRRAWAGLTVVAGVIAAGLGIGYRHVAGDMRPATVTPVSAPAESTISKLIPPAEPSLEPKLAKAQKLPESPASVAVPPATPKVQKKTHAVRPIHAPSADSSPKLTGLDKNGIGIPSN
jgi:hypothetical protein